MEKYLGIMGKIAVKLRPLVGGKDINGFVRTSSSLAESLKLLEELRELLDQYDEEMVKQTMAYHYHYP